MQWKLIYTNVHFFFFLGYVLGKRDAVNGKDLEGSGGDSNDWDAHAEFRNITYWNHDDVPSQDDPILRCFHWFTIADAVSIFQFIVLTNTIVLLFCSYHHVHQTHFNLIF